MLDSFSLKFVFDITYLISIRSKSHLNECFVKHTNMYMTMLFLVDFFKNCTYFVYLFLINIIIFIFLLFLAFIWRRIFFTHRFIIFKIDKILPCFKLFRLKMLKYFSNIKTFTKYIETHFIISFFNLSNRFFKFSLLIY